MPLFEIAILEKPITKKDIEDGVKEKLVFGPQCILAKDADSAIIAVVMENSDKIKNIDRDKMEILVRPFVNPQ